ncbi:MAG: response regulator [Methylococcaceae bacterium]|nr:response regulator [Methylococcaceae bacterium]
MTDRTLLLVDDEPNILKALKRLLHRDGYTILLANGGEDALHILENTPVNVIISDHRMPVMTGIDFLAKVKENYPDITRIVLSGFSDLETITEAINEGNIYKFLAKPWDDAQIRTTIKEAFEYNELRMENDRLTNELKAANTQLIQQNVETSNLLEQIVINNTDGIIVVDSNNKVIFSNPSAVSLLSDDYNVSPDNELTLPFKENQVFHQRLSRKKNDDLILKINCSSIPHEGEQAFLITLHDLSDIERAHEEKKRSEINIKKALFQTVTAISLTVEKRDPYTAGHQNRVARLAVAIGKQLGFNDDRLEGLKIGGLVHDIGKIYIPAEILNRPGPVNEYERLIMQEHTSTGYEIMSTVDFPWPVADMVLQHHENIDGSGYPNGLKGNEIKLEAKIMAVADVVAAMSEYRPYRDIFSISDIIAFIKQESGKKFEPNIVETCINIIASDTYNLNQS